MKITEDVIRRFWSFVRREADGCWEWTGSKKDTGYGQMSIGGRGASPARAHRLSWAIENGPIPHGMHVLHRCDVPHCVRPDHLFLGTQAENMRDMSQKGRASKGPSRRSHCRRGHPLTGDNVDVWRGQRKCKTCRRANRRRRYHAAKS